MEVFVIAVELVCRSAFKAPGVIHSISLLLIIFIIVSLVAQMVKNLPAMWEAWVWSLSWEDPLEKGKVTHSSILAWGIRQTVKSMGLQRVGHDWVAFTFTFIFNIVSQKHQEARVKVSGNRVMKIILKTSTYWVYNARKWFSYGLQWLTPVKLTRVSYIGSICNDPEGN